MKTARLIQDNIPGFNHHAALYELNPPIVDDGVSYKRVIVSSVVHPFTGPETLIFPAHETEPEIADWGELHGSYRGGLSHPEAIKNAGYIITIDPEGADSVKKHSSPEAETACLQLQNEGRRMDVQILRLERQNARTALEKIRSELELAHGGEGQMDEFSRQIYRLALLGLGELDGKPNNTTRKENTDYDR